MTFKRLSHFLFNPIQTSRRALAPVVLKTSSKTRSSFNPWPKGQVVQPEVGLTCRPRVKRNHLEFRNKKQKPVRDYC